MTSWLIALLSFILLIWGQAPAWAESAQSHPRDGDVLLSPLPALPVSPSLMPPAPSTPEVSSTVQPESGRAETSEATADQTKIQGSVNSNESTHEQANENDSSNAKTTTTKTLGQLLEGRTVYTHNFGTDEIMRLAREGITIGSNTTDNYLNLIEGNVLLNPEKDLVVDVEVAKIYVGAGATVFIAKTSNCVVLYDLLQSNVKPTFILVGKKKLTTEPGRMITLVKEHASGFEKIKYCPCKSVAYRNVERIDIHSDEVNAFMADFSILSALVTIQPLKRMTISRYEEDKMALEMFMKNAIVPGVFASPAQPAKTGARNQRQF